MHIVEYAAQEGFAAVSESQVRLSSVMMLLDPCQESKFPASSIKKIDFPCYAIFILLEIY